ncbi:MAG: FAD-dependent oxidoreductase, partial [Propionicimonas sp.]|nr:FAD-dependent oxidoreductase [Propionicimonas sp.]
MAISLTDPLRLRCGVELPNRVLMAPMTTLNAGHDGICSDELPRYYGMRAGGPGAVIVECAHVDPLGKVFPGGIGLDDDAQVPALARVAQAIREKGSLAILQIFHGGRMCSPGQLNGRQPVGPSAVAAPRPEAVVPRELCASEINEIIAAFAATAARAVAAGFDGVEIHGANTYLVQQFFSPHSNRREDEWGGDRAARARFPLAVLRAVKAAVPAEGFVVGYRFSPEEIEVPGIRFDDTVFLLEQLAAEGLDYLHFSTKRLMQTSIVDTSDPQTLLEKLAAVRSETLAAVPLIGVGGVMERTQVEQGLAAGFAGVAVGRELIVEPNWMQKVTAGEPIATFIRREDCTQLAVPESLWNFVEADMAAEERRVNSARAASRVYVPNVYLESFDDLHGVITVKVTVNVDGIEDIAIIGATAAEEQFSEEDVWQVLPERMIALNSTAVDIITGATMSSKRLIAAVDRALAKASGEADPMIVSEHPEEVTPPPWLGAEPAVADDQIETVIQADVIVVGAGVAGVTATRSAAEEGAKVVVFEKASEPQCRSGEYAVINGTLQEAWGRATMDPDEITDRLMKECSYRIKRPIISRWAHHCSEVFDWYIAAKPDLYIAEKNRADIPDENAGSFLVPLYHPLPPHYDYRTEIFPTYPTSVEFLPSQAPVFRANMDKAVAEGEVTAFYGHFVVKLIKDGSRVVGVIARDARTGWHVKALASKGVILATGDYGSNTEMVRYYCPEILENGLPAVWLNRDVEGKPTNTGDGLKLGAWAGARIQQNHAPMVHHMGGTSGTGGVMGNTPWLFLNARGERFMNESVPGQQLENQIELQP